MLLIVRELAFGPKRLAELQRAFPGLSAGALEVRLHRMADDGLLSRRRYAEVPPRVEFALTCAGRELVEILGPIARWALRWAWSSPSADEWVDITALFRLAGCLVEPPADLDAEIELIVQDDAEVAVDLCTLVLSGGEARVINRPAAAADAVLTATVRAWAAAFGPERTRAGVAVSGDAALAELFLSSFELLAGEPR